MGDGEIITCVHRVNYVVWFEPGFSDERIRSEADRELVSARFCYDTV